MPGLFGGGAYSNFNKKCGAHLSNCDGCVLSGLVMSLTLYHTNGVVKSQRVICKKLELPESNNMLILIF